MATAGSSDTFPQVPGYQIQSVIGQGATSVVYRGTRDGEDFAVKVLKLEGGGLRDIDAALRFRQEAAATARLTHPGLVRVLEVGDAGNQPYLVMELVEGESLARVLRRGPLPEEEVVKIGQRLAGALGEVHRRGLVHRDLKPSNIIIDIDGDPKIIDFGFVARMDERRVEETGKPAEVVGTFLYSAPEQLGVLKRTVDGRSDLYALGTVLFQCLTGRPPFVTDSVSVLLQHHAAVVAPNIRDLNPEVHPTLAEVVAKLLSKDPDDRYQSAAGLLADLSDLSGLASARRQGLPVKLGAKDPQFRMVFEIPLVGRKDEMALLERLWQQAKAGQGAVFQVEGEPGMGKTRLARELVLRVQEQKGVVLMGKAQQTERTPFGPLREAIDDYVSRVLRQPREDRDRSSRILREAAGDFAGLVKRLSPGLGRVFGDVPDLRPLEPELEKARFSEKIADFLINVARAHKTMLLLVDDIQWLDEGTTGILKRLADRIRESPVLVATTARNDPASEEARQQFVEELGSERIERAVLGPLDADEVAQFVAAYLGGKMLEEKVLTQLAALSGGNPFALTEYIRGLCDQGMIRPTAERWIADTELFRTVALPSDVSQLLVNRVGTLSRDSDLVLSVAAVVGFEFEHNLLLHAVAGDEELVRKGLGEAFRANLIEQMDETRYRFVHDRVPEALLGKLDEAQLKDIHQALAEAIQRLDDGSGAYVFALARHYAAGHAEKHQRRIYETSLAAGARAIEEHSYNDGFQLLDRALTSAKVVGAGERELGAIEELAGIAASRSGRHAVARDYLQGALAKAATDDDRARLNYVLAEAFNSEGEPEQSLDVLQKAMRFLGVRFPLGMFVRILLIGWYLVRWLFRSWTGLGYGKAKGENQEFREKIADMCQTAFQLTYFLGDALGMVLSNLIQLYHGHFLGTNVWNVKAHSNCATLVAVALGSKKRRARHVDIALSMGEQLGDTLSLAWAKLTDIWASEFSGDPVRVMQIAPEYLPYGRKYGRSWDWAIAAGLVTQTYYLQGRTRECVDWINKNMEQMEKAGSPNMLALLHGTLYACLSLLGRTREALHHRAIQKKMASEMPKAGFVQHFYQGLGISALLDLRDFGPELEELTSSFLQLTRGFPGRYHEFHSRTWFMLVAHCRLEQYLQAKTRAAKKEHFKALKRIVRRSALPMINANYCEIHRCHMQVLKAAIARETGRYRKAARLLARAGDLAEQTNTQWGRWLVLRETARLAARRGADETTLRRAAQLALDVAQREGWRDRIDQLREEFGLQREHRPPALRAVDTAFTATTAGLSAQRYVDALLEVSLATATSLDVERQCRAALDALVKVLGAERAFLFLEEESGSGLLRMQAGRDSTGHDLMPLTGYSTTVVRKVHDTRLAVVVTGTEEGEALGSESAVAYDLRSIMAAPLMLRDRQLGVVYLDSHLVKGLFTTEHLEILRAIASHMAIAVETARQARIEAERGVLQRDMELTAAVQSFFIPKRMAFESSHVAMSGYYRPYTQCSGDWWWYETPTPDSFSLLMGDATGHGASAAMLTAAMASSYRILRKQFAALPLTELLPKLNTEVWELARGQYYVVMSALTVSQSGGTKLSYCSAGSPPAFLMNKRGKVEILSCVGTPLGSEIFSTGQVERPLAPGDRLFVYTDGAYEIQLPDGKELGLKRLATIFGGTRALSVNDASEALVASLIKEAQNEDPFRDDVTFAVIDIKEQPGPGSG